MTQPELDAKIQRYYAEHVDENLRIQGRSAGGAIEHARVRELVSRHLVRPGMRVLDVGGATGVHARWIAELGHQVLLVDPVPQQVARAAALGTFEARVGDARALDVPDASQDVVLLFGPLYHLFAREDRVKALLEGVRVLAPGGVLLAQGIGRLTAFADGVVDTDFSHLTNDDLSMLRTGEWRNPGDGFPGGHFHTAAELEQELLDAGLVDVELAAVEGPQVGSLEWFGPDDELARLGLAMVRRLDERVRAEPDVMPRIADAHSIANLSAHIMAWGRKASSPSCPESSR